MANRSRFQKKLLEKKLDKQELEIPARVVLHLTGRTSLSEFVRESHWAHEFPLEQNIIHSNCSIEQIRIAVLPQSPGGKWEFPRIGSRIETIEKEKCSCILSNISVHPNNAPHSQRYSRQYRPPEGSPRGFPRGRSFRQNCDVYACFWKNYVHDGQGPLQQSHHDVSPIGLPQEILRRGMEPSLSPLVRDFSFLH